MLETSGNHQTQLRFFILWVDFRVYVQSVSTRSTPPTGRARSNRYFSIFKWLNVMPNFEFKKDCVCAHTLNLALDSIVIVIHDRTQGFRPMVSSALWGKAPTARKNTMVDFRTEYFSIHSCWSLNKVLPVRPPTLVNVVREGLGRPRPRRVKNFPNLVKMTGGVGVSWSDTSWLARKAKGDKLILGLPPAPRGFYYSCVGKQMI